ncbi:MAG: IS701 family transposase [Gemmataceae bacterium]
MTEQEIAGLGPAFAAYLGRYRGCFLQKRTTAHFDNYCRGLLSDLPRKTVEPIALESGTAVRTLQEFLTTARWEHSHMRDLLQRHLADAIAMAPADSLGTVGIIDETSCRKWGDETPGVQRQYLGCVGKVDNGIVTVHVGVTKGRFQALLDAALYLPKAWNADRQRCQAAGIPDDVRYRPKWRIALDQLIRLSDQGIAFDWLVFDEGYGAAVPLLRALNLVGQRFVAEVPVNFAIAEVKDGPTQRADQRLSAAFARKGKRYRLVHRTVQDSVWRAATAVVWVAGRQHLLIVAINEATAEVKYFLSNATTSPVARLLAVAFCRWSVEHGFRLAKQEAGLMHYEGRDYTGLMRHLILALVVLGFVATQTERLRGEKSACDSGAGMPGAQPAVCVATTSSSQGSAGAACQRGHLLSPAKKRASDQVPQETAA